MTLVSTCVLTVIDSFANGVAFYIPVESRFGFSEECDDRARGGTCSDPEIVRILVVLRDRPRVVRSGPSAGDAARCNERDA